MSQIQVIDALAWAWLLPAGLSTVYVAWDQFAHNPEAPVMKWGWALVTLYMGPVGLTLGGVFPMTSLSKETELDPEEVILRATRFFGPDGTGLAVRERSSHEVSFEGGGGYVTVHASRTGGGVTVKLVANEWELHAERFLATV